MKIKIQHFTLLLFMLTGLLVILLWSVSLYFETKDSNTEKTKLFRENRQLQLELMQQAQADWLRNRFNEVSVWMDENSDPQQRLKFINQYYQRYPQLRLIQISEASEKPVEQTQKNDFCSQLSDSEIVSAFKAITPVINGCLSNSLSMLRISGKIAWNKPQLLIILGNYFSFLGDFEQSTGTHFYLDSKSATKHHYVETGSGSSEYLHFEFIQDGINFGSISIFAPITRFESVWVQQSLWVIPTGLIILFLLYFILFRELIQPLYLITSRMKKEVLTQRPGTGYDSQFLAPGLLLLHKYFMNLTYMTKHDPLTGLNNRVIFEERLQQAILEGKRSGRKYALVLVDVNHFYKVNKKFGNYMGDGLLKQIALRLIRNLRESDSLARLEKDNFAMLLEFSEEELIKTFVEKIYQSLSQTYTIYGRKIKVGISIGVVFYPDHAQEKEALELKGNEALLQAHNDDWPVVFLKQSNDQAGYSGFSLIQSLRQALDNDDFKLVYQPVIDLEKYATCYFEALLRWKNPQLHTGSIEKTIALAEKNQLIKPLSQWIIQTACQQLKKCSEKNIKIAVNLSMIDLHDENLPDRIKETLNRFAVAPEKLMVEITEGQFMQEPGQVIETLNRLSQMGISLSIDDFGTGQASLTYLKKLPVEKLKIDQSFIKNMVEDKEDSAIVEATIKLAHTLGIKVVAEGVETAEIHSLLMKMGCDYAQGYYISKPIEQEFLKNWIIDECPGQVPVFVD